MVEDGTEVRTIRRARVDWKEGSGSLLVDLVVTESDQLRARPLEPKGNREIFIVDSDSDVLLEAEEIEISPETGEKCGNPERTESDPGVKEMTRDRR